MLCKSCMDIYLSFFANSTKVECFYNENFLYMSDCLLCPMPMTYEMMTSTLKAIRLYLNENNGSMYFNFSNNTNYVWWPVELEKYSFWDISVPSLNCQLKTYNMSDDSIYVYLRIIVARRYGTNPDIVCRGNQVSALMSANQSRSVKLDGVNMDGTYGEGETLAIGIWCFSQTNGANMTLSVNEAAATAKFYN